MAHGRWRHELAAAFRWFFDKTFYTRLSAQIKSREFKCVRETRTLVKIYMSTMHGALYFNINRSYLYIRTQLNIWAKHNSFVIMEICVVCISIIYFSVITRTHTFQHMKHNNKANVRILIALRESRHLERLFSILTQQIIFHFIVWHISKKMSEEKNN